MDAVSASTGKWWLAEVLICATTSKGYVRYSLVRNFRLPHGSEARVLAIREYRAVLTGIIVVVVNSIGLEILVLKFDLIIAAITNGFER